MNQLINDEPIYRTAPARPGLLIIILDTTLDEKISVFVAHHQ